MRLATYVAIKVKPQSGTEIVCSKVKGLTKIGDMTMAAASQLPGRGCSREMYPFLREVQKLKSSA